MTIVPTTSNVKITLYTAHRCPWAHRVHIALNELGIPYSEELIDLDTPRPASYLAINPRGLVPSLVFNDEIIAESGIVTQFLTDAYPSHLVPPSNTVDGALRRARISFFVDAFFSKFHSHIFKLFSTKTDEETRAAVDAALAGLVREVEPLLADAGPFFGGSEKLTLAEVLTASFVIRILALAKAGIYLGRLTEELPVKAPNFNKWAHEVSKHPSVTSIFDEEVFLKYTKARIEKARAT